MDSQIHFKGMSAVILEIESLCVGQFMFCYIRQLNYGWLNTLGIVFKLN